MHAWHDDRRVERDRYAGLLAAGVTDAATLEASSAGVEIWRFSSLCETKEANLQTRNGRVYDVYYRRVANWGGGIDTTG